MSDTQLHDLLDDADGIGVTTIERLEAHGYETVAALAGASREKLTDIPYVSDLRADELQSLAEKAHTDPHEAVFDAELGDRLSVDLAERRGWGNERPVIGTEEPTEWQTAAGGTYRTRRIRIADSPTADSRTEYDLVAAGDSVYATDGTAGGDQWSVAFIEHVGTVQRSTLVQLQVEQSDNETEADRPAGDDTWRQYTKRGEA